MSQTKTTELRVGVFVLVALLIGGSLTFLIGNESSLFRKKVTYKGFFTNVSGLRPGSPVRVAGVTVGTVSEVELNRDGKILVEFTVIESARSLIRTGGVLRIGTKGLLGDKVVDITVGDGTPLPVGATLPAEEAVELSVYMEKAGDLLTEAEGTARNLRMATDPLKDPAFANDIRETTHNLARVSRMAAEGGGTLELLLTDPELARTVRSAVVELKTTSAEFAKTAREVRSIAEQVKQGDGTVHDLLYEEDGTRLIQNMAKAAEEIALLLGEVRTGDGTAHDLLYGDKGDALLDNLNAASADLRYILAALRKGEGTLGAFLMDPSIYEDVKRLVGDLERNKILRSLVRYSIRKDEARKVESAPKP